MKKSGWYSTSPAEAGTVLNAHQVRRMVATNPMVLEHPADGLFRIAFADNRICAAEDAYLREVARHFGFEVPDYARIRAHPFEPNKASCGNAMRSSAWPLTLRSARSESHTVGSRVQATPNSSWRKV
jgi:hypothetical protein